MPVFASLVSSQVLCQIMLVKCEARREKEFGNELCHKLDRVNFFPVYQGIYSFLPNKSGSKRTQLGLSAAKYLIGSVQSSCIMLSQSIFVYLYAYVARIPFRCRHLLSILFVCKISHRTICYFTFNSFFGALYPQSFGLFVSSPLNICRCVQPFLQCCESKMIQSGFLDPASLSKHFRDF